MKSEPFNAFAAAAGPLFATPFTLDDYEPADVGFLTRPGVGTKFVEDSLILHVEFVLKPGTRDRFLKEVALIAEDVKANEPNCYSYYGLKSLDNPDKVAIFERYNGSPIIQILLINDF